MAATSLGMKVILTEPCAWIGGQLTSQMVPPDEHRWIEEFGCTARYRTYRNGVRDAYRRRGDLTPAALSEKHLNPGGGWVSRLCHLPSVGVTVLLEMLNPALAAGLLDIRTGLEPTAADVHSDLIEAVTFQDLIGGRQVELIGKIVIDATELGDVIKLSGQPYRIGSEGPEFGEAHAGRRDPTDIQGFTWCFALECRPDHSVPTERPDDFDTWRSYRPNDWPGPLIGLSFPDPVTGMARSLPILDSAGNSSLFGYRQIVDPSHHTSGLPAVTSVNWPQNDYLLGDAVDVGPDVRRRRLNEAKALGRSLLYWLQTEAPRPDGGIGFPELVLAGRNITGTDDGFAMAPYYRESRRIEAVATITEEMISSEAHYGLDRAPEMPMSVGVGAYRIDLHPSPTAGYIDVEALPFQIPLGALIPVRARNLLPGAKNIGTTHITNGCYRLHPVEWNVGEAAGIIAALAVKRQEPPVAAIEISAFWTDLDRRLHLEGIETRWPPNL